MSRLVVVSNRVADPRKAAAGGLAVALGEALQRTGGLWFGWSGKIVEASEGGVPGQGAVAEQRAGGVKLVTVDLCRQDHDGYYLGYANRVLWPVFHYRLDLAEFNPESLATYQRVNRMFAQRLMEQLKEGDTVWVHDYHLIPLAAELRALGSKHRIGFFLHIPLPPQQILAAIPGHEWFMRALFSYDLLGFQSETDVTHFERYVETEAGAQGLPNGRYRAFNHTVVAKAFPIGIDVREFLALGRGKESLSNHAMMVKEYAKRRLVIGIDRLDYSKGLPHRVRAFKELLQKYPEQRRSATLIQIASPSREDVDAYTDIRHELESLCGEINGDYGELDWMPIRYIHRTVARKRLPGLYRAGRVALITPLRDGMNLVAKEFIAAQDPADPGVLVLSRFAGAAEQLREALLVNPYDIQGTADVIQRALSMPLEERVTRHTALMASISRYDVHWWHREFLQTLASVEVD